MGIGVSYYGYDGRQRKMDFDGSAEAQKKFEELAGMGREESRPASGMHLPKRSHHVPISQPERKAEPDHKVKATEYDPPGYLGDKIDPTGSLQMFLGRLVLKGDTETAGGDGMAVYMRKGSRRLWGGIEDLDPAKIGALIGPEVGMGAYEEDTTKWQLGDKSAPTMNVCTRQICQPVYPDNGSPTPFLNFFSFWRKWSFTPHGRLVQIGGEVRQLLATVVMGGSGKFEVRPYYCKASNTSPNHTDCYLTYLAFGPGDSLAALPEVLPTDIREVPEYKDCYIVPVEPLEVDGRNA